MSPLFQLTAYSRMSPLFQLVYSTTSSLDECLVLLNRSAYSLDESLIPTGFIQPWMKSLIPTGFIQPLIPWLSPLFQLVYSTAYSLDESLIPTGFIQLLFRWPPLFGRTFYSTTGFIQQLFLFNCLFPG